MSPGEKAFNAYRETRGHDWVPAPWEGQGAENQAAWERFAEYSLKLDVGDARTLAGLYGSLSWAYIVENMPDLVMVWTAAWEAARTKDER